MARRIVYQAGTYVVYALTDAQAARMDALRCRAEEAYLSGQEVMQIYVSSLELDKPDFKVCIGADYDEIKIMVEGHLQLAEVRSLALCA